MLFTTLRNFLSETYKFSSQKFVFILLSKNAYPKCLETPNLFQGLVNKHLEELSTISLFFVNPVPTSVSQDSCTVLYTNVLDAIFTQICSQLEIWNSVARGSGRIISQIAASYPRYGEQCFLKKNYLLRSKI